MMISTRSTYILLLFIIFFSEVPCFAQEKVPVVFGRVKAEDFNIKSSLVDENTTAVIIADVGSLHFEGNSKGWFTYVYKRQTRIKLLNKKSFDLANLSIHLYRMDDAVEQLSKVSATAYNMENNSVTQTDLDAKDIYEEKYDKNHLLKKFAVPGIKEGSIIEYNYTVKSDFEFNLPEWKFQSTEAPVLWSEYNVSIPNMLEYVTWQQGFHDFFINEGADGFDNYVIRRKRSAGGYERDNEESISVSCPLVKHKWVKKDLPAFNEAGFIFSPGNYIDKLSFQLNRTYDGLNYHDQWNSWGKVAQELIKKENFGWELQQDNVWLDDILKSIGAANSSIEDAAKKIYNYVQANYTCTNGYSKYLSSNLKNVVNKKNGSVGDINLLLAALLKQKGITADPVLLSTREFGHNVEQYPILDKLNYVICRAIIGNNIYYLDASQPFIPFGKLPLNCYNGHARVIAADTTAVYFTADSLIETKYTNLSFLKEGNTVSGTYKSTLGFVKSIETRNLVAKESERTYLNTIKAAYPEEIIITDMKAEAVNEIEKPVEVNFKIKLNSFGDNEIVYFLPMLADAIKENPFKAATRFYPLEMPYQMDNIFILNMDVPQNYTVEEIPKQVRVNLNENDGFFEYLVENKNGHIQLFSRLKITKTLFSGDDYQTLRDFYAYIINKEAEAIVFKKIK